MELENAFRQGKDLIPCLDSKITIKRNPPNLEYLKALGPWNDIVLLEFQSPGNMKTLVSLVHLAMKETILLPFLISVNNSNRKDMEGMAYNAQSLAKLHFKSYAEPPENLLNLKGILELYNSRFDESGEATAEIEVEYTKNKFVWIPKSTPSPYSWGLDQIKKYSNSRYWESLIVLNIRVVFPQSDPLKFMNCAIDPLAGKWQVKLAVDNKRLTPVSDMLMRFYEAFDALDNRQIVSGTTDFYLPGAFDFELVEPMTARLNVMDMNLNKERYLVDTVDIENALYYIFNEDIPQPARESPRSTEKLIENLRYKNSAVPKESLWWKLATRLFDCSSLDPKHLTFEVTPFALLRGIWPEFLRQVRTYWDSLEYIPNVSNIKVEREYLGLHQQLCMLNCCIRKMKSKMNEKTNNQDFGFTPQSWKSESSWEKVTSVGSHGRFSTADLLPPPKIFGGESLPKIIIPETQLACPMTDEMFMENDLILQSFGTDEAGQKARLRYQSTHLLSDMSAFKASNPFAPFEDFVFWYSPKDWRQDESGRGQLSSRFTGENCSLWHELWLEAKPILASKQKQLFDAEKEAAKVLNRLDGYSELEVFSMVKPLVSLIAFESITLQCQNESKSLNILFEEISASHSNEISVQVFKDAECPIILQNILRDSVLFIAN